MKYYLFLLLFLLSNNLFCQDNFQELDFLFPGDSIPSNTFMLDEVTVYQPLTFENDDEIKRYVILRYRVKKVYSYAKLCLLYTSPSPRDATLSRMPSSA